MPNGPMARPLAVYGRTRDVRAQGSDFLAPWPRFLDNAGTGRQIPMNQELFDLMKDHAQWLTLRFGETQPEHFLFPDGECWPNNPTQPSKRFQTAWGNLRKKANVRCRIHDLRHTAITKLAESGASDSTIMALAGHLSRAMMERNSHIRMNAKRQAVESLSLKPKIQPAPQSFPQSPAEFPLLHTQKPA
jgi:integrase